MLEEWKYIPGYGELYKVSDKGKIVGTRRKGRILSSVKELKAQPNSRGYLRVQLTDENGNKKRYFVHRLVAELFIEKPDGCDVVNHLDFDYTNNAASNLEWTTQKGNYDYSFCRGRFTRTDEWKSNLKKSLDKKMATPVVGTKIDTGEKIHFNAMNDVSQFGFHPACVCECCKGKRLSHSGYFWEYVR